jgi:hypothetical protein
MNRENVMWGKFSTNLVRLHHIIYLNECLNTLFIKFIILIIKVHELTKFLDNLHNIYICILIKRFKLHAIEEKSNDVREYYWFIRREYLSQGLRVIYLVKHRDTVRGLSYIQLSRISYWSDINFFTLWG